MSKDIRDIEKFLLIAFDVDGTVSARDGISVVTDTKDGFWSKGLLFEINDKDRGVFHVGIFDDRAKKV